MLLIPAYEYAQNSGSGFHSYGIFRGGHDGGAPQGYYFGGSYNNDTSLRNGTNGANTDISAGVDMGRVTTLRIPHDFDSYTEYEHENKVNKVDE